MKMKSILTSLVLFINLSSAEFAHAQTWLTEKVKQILLFQNRRDMTLHKLNDYLIDADRDIRRRAALAFASVQDSSALYDLINVLNDPEGIVRATVAFALGQISSHTAFEPLYQQLEKEKDQKVRYRLFEALGKIARESDIDRLVVRMKSPSPGDEDALALFFVRCAIRNVVSLHSLDLLTKISRSNNASARIFAAYTFSRMRKPEFIAPVSSVIRTLMNDPSSDVRMFAALAVEYVKDSVLFNEIASNHVRDRDWRVRVNLLRAIGNSQTAFSEERIKEIISQVSAKEVHTSITAFQTLAAKKNVINPESARGLQETILRIMYSRSAEISLKSEAAKTFARVFPAITGSALKKMIANSTGTLQAKYLEALGWIREQDLCSFFLAFPVNEKDIQLRMSIMYALHQQKDFATEGERQLIVDYYLKSMKSVDIALITLAAEYCADSLYLSIRTKDIPRTAREALHRLSNITDVEPIVALCDLLARCKDEFATKELKQKLVMPDKIISSTAAKALTEITRVDHSALIYQPSSFLAHDIDWEYLSKLRENERIVVKTNTGSFIVRLSVNDAPLTTMNILRLIDRKFYDGLTFHRVVPNFVIQGGDPRGDGWGGPGWTMKSEFGMKSFTRGAIGIASAGKDTEGSQFFITHCRTPHLDGRYTCFGEVVTGMEVVDRIQVGDKILSITRVH